MTTSSLTDRTPPTIVALPPHRQPEIVCPAWCVVPMSEHVAALPNWEGMVIHWSAGDVRHSSEAYPDGTPDPDEPPMIWLDGIKTGDGVTLEYAEQAARAILRAVKEARA